MSTADFLKTFLRLLSASILAGLFLTSCGPEPTTQPTIIVPASTLESASLPALSPTTIPTTPTPIPQPTVAEPDPPTPTASPTAVPKTPVHIYLPDTMPHPWQEAIPALIGQLQANGLIWDWQMTADPTTADLAVQQSSDGLPIFQHPIALSVPFTTDWEDTTSTQAQEIVQNGHSLVTVKTWESMVPSEKALRIDGFHPNDPAYPLQQSWSLMVKTGFEDAASKLTAEIQASPPPDSIVQITAVGDIMLSRSLGGAIRAGNLAYPFEDVLHLLNGADITVGNVESALGDIGQPAPKSYAFQAPPGAAESLALAGFDVVSLANNHGMDYGPESLLQGLDLLRQHNVAPIGAGANAAEAHTPYIQEVNGLRLAFLGYVHVPVEGLTAFDVETWDAGENAPGLAWAYPERITADVTAAKEQADLVIVILHSGYEYVDAPSPPQVAASYAAIDAGAALVIGHHAHILQGIEFYKEGVIVYGLGNFAFEIDGDPSTAVLNVWLDKDGVHQIEIIPAIIQFGGQPRPAEPYEARPILQRIYFLTTLLNAQ